MKNTIKYYILSFLFLLCLTFFSTLILAFLKTKGILSYSVTNVICLILSYCYAAIISFYLGLKLKKHGWLHALIIILLFTLLTLIFGNSLFEINNLIKYSVKSLIVIFFTILGVNISK